MEDGCRARGGVLVIGRPLVGDLLSPFRLTSCCWPSMAGHKQYILSYRIIAIETVVLTADTSPGLGARVLHNCEFLTDVLSCDAARAVPYSIVASVSKSSLFAGCFILT